MRHIIKDNQEFGRLTALCRGHDNITSTKSRKMLWVLCSCGVVSLKRMDSLVSGRTQSCGCMSHNRSAWKNKSTMHIQRTTGGSSRAQQPTFKIGDKFGVFTVINYLGRQQPQHWKWKTHIYKMRCRRCDREYERRQSALSAWLLKPPKSCVKCRHEHHRDPIPADNELSFAFGEMSRGQLVTSKKNLFHTQPAPPSVLSMDYPDYK